jgi:hypothetical protein
MGRFHASMISRQSPLQLLPVSVSRCVVEGGRCRWERRVRLRARLVRQVVRTGVSRVAECVRPSGRRVAVRRAGRLAMIICHTRPVELRRRTGEIAPGLLKLTVPPSGSTPARHRVFGVGPITRGQRLVQHGDVISGGIAAWHCLLAAAETVQIRSMRIRFNPTCV